VSFFEFPFRSKPKNASKPHHIPIAITKRDQIQ